MGKFPAISPFKLLQSYDKSDTKVYFGRDRETRLLAESLKRSKFILLYGASGTGKTSLIQCGLQGMLSARDWMPVFVRRGGSFLESLHFQLSTEYTARFGLRYPEKPLPNTAGWALRDLVQALFSLTYLPIYLILDQFEEIFTQGDKAEQDAFFTFLQEFRLFEEDLFCKILLVVREEYIAHFYAYESQLPFLFESRFRVEKMRREQLAEVIEKTLTYSYAGYPPLKVEKEAVAQILHNLTDAKGETDLTDLQVYLDRLYHEAVEKRTPEDEGPLVFDRALAGENKLENVLSGFLEQQIERADRQLTPADTANVAPVALVILFKLVTPEGTKQQRNATQIFDELTLGKTRMEEPRLQTALALLSGPEMRLLNRVRFTGDAGEYYEIWHDRLAAQVFRKFSADEMRQREALVTLRNKQKRFDAAPNLRERRAEYLSQGEAALIGQSLNLARIPDEQRAFYESSLNWHRKQRRLERQRFAAAVAAAVVFALLALAAWYAWQRSETARLHNQGLAESAYNPTTGLLKIAAAIRRDPSDFNKRRDFYNVRARSLLYETVFTQTKEQLNAVAFSPDGQFFATATGSLLRLYRTGQAAPVDSFMAENAINHLLFYGNDTLWAGSEDRKARQFAGPASGGRLRVVRTLETDENIQRLATDAKGQWLATLHNQNFVQLWRLQGRDTLWEKWEVEEIVSATSLSADGQWWAAGTEAGQVLLRSIRARSAPYLLQLPVGPSVAVRELTFSPDGRWLAAAFRDGQVCLFEAKSAAASEAGETSGRYELVQTLAAGEAGWNVATFSDDSHLLLLAADNGSGQVLEVPSLRLLFPLLPGNHQAFIQAQWTGTQDDVYTAAINGEIRRWPFPRPFPDRVVAADISGSQRLLFDADGEYLLLQSADSLVRLYDAKSLAGHPFYGGHTQTVTALAAGRQKAVSADESGAVHIWDLKTATRLAAVMYPEGRVYHLAVNTDASLIVMAGGDSTAVLLWRPDLQKTVVLGVPGQLVTAVATAPDGSSCWVAGFDSVLTRYDTSGAVTGHIRLPSIALQLDIKAQGDTVCVTGPDGSYGCYVSGKKIPMNPLPAQDWTDWSANRAVYATFAPENGNDQRCSLRLFSAEGLPLQTFRYAGCDLTAFALHPDGHALVAVSSSGQIALWKVRRGPVLINY
jgi:WD40 repeat protein